MSSVHDSRVVPFHGGPRRPTPRASNTELLHHIIQTQGELGRAGLKPLKVVEIITRRAQELTRSSGAVVEMIDGEEMVYWSASGSTSSQLGLRLPIDGSLSGRCVRTGQALRCDDIESDARTNREAGRQVGVRSAVAMPLLCEEHLVGVLKVVSPFTYAYDEEDLNTLNLLGSFIGAALHHALEHERLRARHPSDDEAIAPDDRDALAKRQRIEAVLLEPRRITPVFQPIIDLFSGRIVGVEGLSRFPAGPGGSPEAWFAHATQVGLGVPLELACARRVLEVLPHLPSDQYVAVNVSPAALMSPDLDELLPSSIAERVVLEVTETSEVAHYTPLMSQLAIYRGRGARVAVDDTGAGFASLRHVLRLEPESIKLDVSLTRDIDASHRHRTLASALLMFARDTSSTLVAEGIETSAEMATLRALGIQQGQGYLLGRPVRYAGLN
jgi:EAL domain-containing protein (putative c-di-GMP-specific phosphodiesterase class I)